VKARVEGAIGESGGEQKGGAGSRERLFSETGVPDNGLGRAAKISNANGSLTDSWRTPRGVLSAQIGDEAINRISPRDEGAPARFSRRRHKYSSDAATPTFHARACGIYTVTAMYAMPPRRGLERESKPLMQRMRRRMMHRRYLEHKSKLEAALPTRPELEFTPNRKVAKSNGRV